MEARAQARFVRVAPRKARRVVDVIRNKPVLEAYDILEFAPYMVAPDILKVLRSAVANARVKAEGAGERFREEDYRIVEAYVNEGPTMKRFRPRAQGRAAQILKRTSHITLVVGTKNERKEGR